MNVFFEWIDPARVQLAISNLRVFLSDYLFSKGFCAAQVKDMVFKNNLVYSTMSKFSAWSAAAFMSLGAS